MERSPDRFEVVAGRGFFRPIGRMSLQAAVELVDTALAYARAHGIKELMVNGILVTGFPPPTLRERYFFVEKWARVAGGAIRLAMVVREEMIDPQKFGVTVALNRGLIGDVFVSEVAAVSWLDSRDPPSIPSASRLARGGDWYRRNMDDQSSRLSTNLD